LLIIVISIFSFINNLLIYKHNAKNLKPTIINSDSQCGGDLRYPKLRKPQTNTSGSIDFLIFRGEVFFITSDIGNLIVAERQKSVA